MKPAAYVVTLVANPEESALSDALIARAAQVLPGFAGSQWLAPGVAADLFYDGEADARGLVTPLVAAERDRRDRPGDRHARQAPAGRRHGFDPDRPGVHRRTRRFCRRRGLCRRDHRARHAGRDRLRGGAARARGAARRPAGKRDRRGAGNAHHADVRRAHFGAHHAARAAAMWRSSPAAFSNSPARSPSGSERASIAPTAC